MMSIHRALSCFPLLPLAPLLLLTPLCHATTYNCSAESVQGASFVEANDISNSGIAVGYYRTDVEHGFVQNTITGSFSTLDYTAPPGSTNTRLLSINNNGLILGSQQNGIITGYFTVDTSGNFTPVAVPSPYTLFSAWGINDNNAISALVGQPETSNGTPYTDYNFAILNSDGSITIAPGCSNYLLMCEGLPGGLNNSSQMLETEYNGAGVTLAAPNGIIAHPLFLNSPTYAWGVNNPGSVVGYAFPQNGQPPYYDFTFDSASGAYSEVVCQGSSQPALFGINDSGVLSGTSIATPQTGLARFSISTSTVVFPSTPVGQSSTMPLTITNTGTVRLDMYYSIALPPGFRMDTGCFSAVGPTSSLNPGASCTTNITASPTAQGTATIPVSIHDSAPGSPHTFTITETGTVAPPTCQVSTSGTGQANLTLQDTNSGLQTITLYAEMDATVSIPSFTSGTTSPVTATATQTNLYEPGEVSLQATNVAGGSTVCTASFNGPSGPPQWLGTGGSISGKISVVTRSDGSLQAFARGTDNALWTISQTAPDGPWGTWGSIGGVLTSDPAVALNANQTLEAYVRGSDNGLWEITNPGAPFPTETWRGLAGTLTSDPAVTADPNLNVFAVGSDNALWTIAESAPGVWGNWTSLGGVALHNPAAVTNTDGSLEVFVVGADNAIWYNQTVDTAGDWSGWASLGGSFAGSPVALVNSHDGIVMVLGLGTDNTYWYAFHQPGAPWSAFTSLGGYLTSDPAAVFDTNGFLEVFGRGGDNALWYTPIGVTQPWTSLGGTLAGGPTAAINQDGRVAVFVEGTDTTMWTIEQSTPGSWQ